MRPFVVVAALAAIVVAATPAFAQNVNRDTVTIGVGGAIVPRYEGANDYELSPAAAIRGRVSGIGFSTLGTSLFVDLIAPPAESTTGKLVLGPAARLGLSRSSTRRTRDPQIVALGRVPVSVEVGGHIGYSKTGVITSDFDNLSFDLAVLHDVTDVHRSAVVTPSINYGTPLSRKAFVGASISATHVGDGYARRYFGVTPAQSLASGLRRYTPGSGFKDVTVGTLANFALTGDLLGGLSLFGVGSYSRLLGDFGRSPVVRNRNQWFGTVGLAYTF